MTFASTATLPASAAKIGFVFSLGHGHYAQFLNFQECAPPEYAGALEWIGLSGYSSGDPLTRLEWLPGGLRWRRNQHWHFREGYGRHRQWRAVFLAGTQASFRSFMLRQPTYLYTDLTPSIKQELAPWYENQMRGPALLQTLRHRVQQRVFDVATGVITMSAWAGRGVVRDHGVPPSRVFTILPGANLRRWEYVDRSRRAPGAPARLLMVGGEFRRKGGLEMLAWAESTRRKNWELDIVTWPGDLPDWVREALGNPGPHDKVSGSLAPRLPNVRVHCGLMANTPEIMDLFRNADVFCLPTHADGSSIASLEAMATGLPVVVGAVGGIPELIHDGETGMLIPRDDTQVLADRLEALIADGDLRLRMGRRARESCEDFYNVTRQMRQIMAVMLEGPDR